MGLCKEDKTSTVSFAAVWIYKNGLRYRCVQRWIGFPEQPGQQCYENGNNNSSFCLLITYCQHLQSVNEIITTVNSGPVIG